MLTIDDKLYLGLQVSCQHLSAYCVSSAYFLFGGFISIRTIISFF